MSCNRETLNITARTDVILNVTLEHDGIVLNPALIDNLQANLVTGLGKRTPLEVSPSADYLVVNIPWVDGRIPGYYSLEITGSINNLAWSAVGKSIIRYTSATEIGPGTVDVTGDVYDVTMEVGYYYTDSPIEGVSAAIDDGVGEPSVETSYIRRQLSFNFHNLKGNGITSIETDEHQGDEAINTVTIKTDLDDEGIDFHVRNGSRGNGIASSSEVLSPDDGGTNVFTITDDDGNNHAFHSKNGRTGKQGDSAVFDPSTGNIAAIKQTTGDDANSPMSQKAVTEELVALDAKDRFTIPVNWNNNGKYYNADGDLSSSSAYANAILKVSEYRGKRIRITTDNGNTSYQLFFVGSTKLTSQAGSGGKSTWDTIIPETATELRLSNKPGSLAEPTVEIEIVDKSTINALSYYSILPAGVGYYGINGAIVEAQDKNTYRHFLLRMCCEQGDSYFYRGRSGLAAVAALFYDADGVLIDNAKWSDSFSVHEGVITAPANANFVVFQSVNRTTMDNGKTTDFQVIPLGKNPLLKNVSGIITEQDGYLRSNGQYYDTTNWKSKSTPKIPCSPGDIFLYRGKGRRLAMSYLAYNGDEIVAYNTIDHKGDAVGYNNVIVPEGADGIIFSSYDSKSSTVELDVIKVGKEATNVINGADAPLLGKKINWLGDSYVANNGQDVELTWHYKIAEKYDMTYRNYGINGNGMVAGNNPMVSRYTEMDADADYVMVVGGTNDFHRQISLDTFKSAIGTFIENLVSMYPTSRIAFFTPFLRPDTDAPMYPISGQETIPLRQYSEAIKEVCESYSVPCFCMTKESGMYPWNAAVRTAYYQSSTDKSHLNAAGHLRFMTRAESFLLSL